MIETTVTAAQVIAIARSQIGYIGGPGPTSKYGEWYGINPGNWCAMFISWCGDQAARQQHSENPYKGLESDKGYAYTPNGYAGFQRQGTAYLTDKQVRVGDIVFFDYGMGRISHTGLVDSVTAQGFSTIEGNTSGPGGRDGNTVAAHTYSWGDSHWRGGGHPAYAGSSGNLDPIPGFDKNPIAVGDGGDHSNGANDIWRLLGIGGGLHLERLLILAGIVIVGAIIVFSQAT